ILKAEGYGPRLTFGGFAAAVRLADVISETILSPIRRAEFMATAAADLAALDYQPLEGLEDVIDSFVARAEAERPTPCGAVELWGSLFQMVERA
ncbi:hypothetical protein NL446_26305, partial [Klebsiella pneumoniae]|nr:hypothetical protein [Klebsiella pneumoniae]